jgi:hypothetical protein
MNAGAGSKTFLSFAAPPSSLRSETPFSVRSARASTPSGRDESRPPAVGLADITERALPNPLSAKSTDGSVSRQLDLVRPTAANPQCPSFRSAENLSKINLSLDYYCSVPYVRMALPARATNKNDKKLFWLDTEASRGRKPRVELGSEVFVSSAKIAMPQRSRASAIDSGV